jgi:hypothetical protein
MSCQSVSKLAPHLAVRLKITLQTRNMTAVKHAQEACKLVKRGSFGAGQLLNRELLHDYVIVFIEDAHGDNLSGTRRQRVIQRL